MSSVNAEILNGPDKIREDVIKHLASPINWYKVVGAIYRQGRSTVIECGPGISLTQNARFISGSARWINVKNIFHRLGL
jgi:hypothetical protein